jgi:hypothetical protein
MKQEKTSNDGISSITVDAPAQLSSTGAIIELLTAQANGIGPSVVFNVLLRRPQ